MWTSPWRIYTNPKKTKLVAADDPDAVLLCGEWDRIPIEDARRLGLVDADGNEHSPQAIKARQTREVKAKEQVDG
jgi:hypothetical protein